MTTTPGWRVEREIYGYPQQLGDVCITADDDAVPKLLRLKASAIRKFGPERMG